MTDSQTIAAMARAMYDHHRLASIHSRPRWEFLPDITRAHWRRLASIGYVIAVRAEHGVGQ